MTSARMSVITDWRTDDDALPDVLPGEGYDRVITPQKPVTLCRILVLHNLQLFRLRIGAEEIPFRLEGCDGNRRGYRPMIQGTTANEIAIAAGQDVRITLRNDSLYAVKPRAALLVREEL